VQALWHEIARLQQETRPPAALQGVKYPKTPIAETMKNNDLLCLWETRYQQKKLSGKQELSTVNHKSVSQSTNVRKKSSSDKR
jgi:hypothetical protein